MGRVAAGKSAGGLCYGYKPAPKIIGEGSIERGDRRIDEAEATIVQRIFRSFAEGLSPIAIAKQLNQEGIPGPGGRPWGDTTIRGHAERATGILRNELYIGRLVWNRMRYVKDPATGKRISRMNPPEQWVTEEVPALRIIEPALWERVQQRLAGIRQTSGANNPDRPKYWETRRVQHLLTGKLFCACCGGPLSAVGRDYLACGAARKRGTCTNMTSLRRSRLETQILEALRANLLSPEAVHEFITAFTAEWNRLAAESNAERAQDKTRLATIQRKIDRIVEAITEGFRTPEMKDQLEALSQQKAQLQTRVSAPTAAAPSLHPNLGELYRRRVETLHAELAAANGNNNAALETLRDLIDRVDIGPGSSGEPEIILTGALSSMIRLGLDNKPMISTASGQCLDVDSGIFDCSVKVVAGARFERATFRL
ncbi:MAG: recombinase family protein [Rhodospirillales bacterium]|nr:recombinase family protein [Rhodospirillales bacterium]